MPYSRISVEDDRAQQLFWEVVYTVPRLSYKSFGSRAKSKPTIPFSADMSFLRGKSEWLKIHTEGTTQFDQLLKKMPRLMKVGYLIGTSQLKLFPFMKSYINFFPGEEDSIIQLWIPRPFLEALDPEGQVMGWWNRLGEKFNQKPIDPPIDS